MVNSLTPKQDRLLRGIIGFIEKNGCPPSIREALPLANVSSTRSVTQYLKALEDAGYIEREAGTRKIRVLIDPTEAQRTAKVAAPTRRKRKADPRSLRRGLLVDATDLQAWADRRDSQSAFPELVRRLVHATTERPIRASFASGEGVQLGGWDGITDVEYRTPFVPAGSCGWELGTNSGVRGKADDDFETRVTSPGDLVPSVTTFICGTLRRWRDKEKWVADRRKERKWRDVRAYDADDLEQWLERAPAVHIWLSMRLGKHPLGVIDLDSFWDQWAGATNPELSAELVLAGRDKAATEIGTWLTSGCAPLVLQAETREEAVTVFAAAVKMLPERERLSHQSRTVVVSTSEAWQQLSISHEPLILIPLFDSRAAVTNAVRNGQHVVIPLGRSDSTSQKTVAVGPVKCEAAEKALKALGVEEIRARELASLLRRSTTAFRRHIAVTPELQQPAWAEPTTGRQLLSALLAGKWDETNEDDRGVLSKLAGVSYEGVMAHLVRWANETDPPVRHVGRYWFIVSKEDSWPLLARYLTRDDLRRFHDVAVEVLGTRDPRYDLTPDKQWMASVLDHGPTYSPSLAEGLSDTLALMGAMGEVTRTTAGESARAVATGAIWRLMERMNADNRLWASLSHVLALLAEAAPDPFLDGVDAGLSGDPPVLRSMFTDAKGSSFMVSSPHTGLLWALERLGWAPEYLCRAAIALARLAVIDPGGTVANRPAASLRQLFLFWHPQTHATIEQRLRVIDRLRRAVPDAAWELMVALLPKSHDMSMNHGPAAWREWGMERPEVTHAEYARAVHEVVRRMLEDVGVSGERWRDLIEQLSKLSTSDEATVLDALAALDVETLAPAARSEVWHALRRLISLHRTHNDATWALPMEQIGRLVELHGRFMPVELQDRFAWLFDGRPALLEGRETDWEQHQAVLTNHRVNAVRETYGNGGLAAVVEFARRVEHPNDVGIALAASEAADEIAESVLSTYLAAPEKSDERFARGFAWESVRRRGRAWAEGLLTRAGGGWRSDQRAELLVCLPYDDTAWGLVDQGDAETEAAYWRRVYAFGIPETHVEYGARKLLHHGRPFAAVDYLAGRTHLNKKAPPRAALIADALDAVVRAKPSELDPIGQNFGYDVGELLDTLAKNPGDVPLSRIAALEWAFVPVLSHNERTPRVLHDELGRDPDFFAELVEIVYRAKGEEPRTLTDGEEARARSAHDLLDSWRTVPGTSPLGTIDPAALREWVEQARARLDNSGRGVIGDIVIGHVLSGSPTGDDGLWPHPAVRDLLEDVASSDIERGISIGVYNSRGVVSRSLDEGGEQERELVERHSAYAAAMTDRWPRTAAMLRGIAESYDEDAARADVDVELRANLES